MSDSGTQDASHALLVGLLAQSLQRHGTWAASGQPRLAGPKRSDSADSKRALQVRTNAIDQKPARLSIANIRRHEATGQTRLPPIYESVSSQTESINEKIMGASQVSTPPPSDDEESNQDVILIDTPLSTLEIVRFFVGRASTQADSGFSDNSTIHELAGTDQENDVLSDLHAEFGPLPENAENVALRDLSDSLGRSFDGKLGRRTISLVTKMIANKMPPRFSLARIKKYLHLRWSLGPGPQDSILLQGVGHQPVVRLKSISAAKHYLDVIVQTYSDQHELDLERRDSAVESEYGSNHTRLVTSPTQHTTTSLDPDNDQDKSLELCSQLLQERIQNGDVQALRLQIEATKLLKLMDTWRKQHAPKAFEGFEPAFNVQKIKKYNSSGNWALQDLYSLVYDVMLDRSSITGIEVDHQASLLSNRANTTLLKAVSYLKSKYSGRGAARSSKSMDYVLSKLLKYFEEASLAAPAAVTGYTNLGLLTSPKQRHDVNYSPTSRMGAHTPLYTPFRFGSLTPAQTPVYTPLRFGSLTPAPTGSRTPARGLPTLMLQEYQDTNSPGARNIPRVTITSITPLPDALPTPSAGAFSPSIYSTDTSVKRGGSSVSEGSDGGLPPPFTPAVISRAYDMSCIHKKVDGRWDIDPLYTSAYSNTLDVAASYGMSFAEKQVLVTGATPDSVAEEIVRHLLSGGARIAVTSPTCDAKERARFQSIYATYGARGSELILVPFNQGNETDADALAKYVYCDMGWSLDHVFPFGGIAQYDKHRPELMSDSARGQMWAQTLRLLNAIKAQKEAVGLKNWPAQVMLPLSPSSAMFADDAEDSNLGNALGALFTKWYSENWNEYLSLCGVVIGMTDGTAPLKNNPALTQEVRKLGAKVFTPGEMASGILGLLMPLMLGLTEREPIIADMSGGLSSIQGLDELMRVIEDTVAQRAEAEDTTPVDPRRKVHDEFSPSASIDLEFPRLPDYQTEVEPISKYRRDMVDLDRVAVIVGFSEIGPLGNSRTRRQQELNSRLSPDACLELAWIMGLVKYSNHEIIDAKTEEVLPAFMVKERYLNHILEHTGIRLVENATEVSLQEVTIQEDLPSFEASSEAAAEFQNVQGDKVVVFEHPVSGQCLVQLKKGAILHLPKLSATSTTPLGHVPDGWDPRVYGISQDLIDQVDRSSLYSLVTTIEAFISAGVTDPYEIYQYVHVSGVTTFTGTGKTRNGMYNHTPTEDSKPAIHSVGAFVNSVLLGSVGMSVNSAGLSAAESLKLGYEAITLGKAKVCVVGDACDSADVTRAENQSMSFGAGTQILTTARLALDMGLPIHAVVAYSHSTSDACHSSGVARGSGLLTAVAEIPLLRSSPMLSLKYRQRQLELRLQEIDEWSSTELVYLQDQGQTPSVPYTEDVTPEAEFLNEAVSRQRKEALTTFGNLFWKGDCHIAPLRGALATWGLAADDIGVVSFSGTHNDLAESRVINEQMSRLDRSEGNPLFAVYQQPVVGHAAGVSSAWSLNSCLQILDSGIVPGDRTIDNVDAPFQHLHHIMYPSKNIYTPGMDAFACTSIENGKSTQTVGVHPKYLFATIGEEEFAKYADKREQRCREAETFFSTGLAENSLFQHKTKAPWSDADLQRILTDPTARLCTA